MTHDTADIGADPAVRHYQSGEYSVSFGDGAWKAEQAARLIAELPSSAVHSYADVGCGDGGVFVEFCRRLRQAGHPVSRATGYDVFEGFAAAAAANPDLEFRVADFRAESAHYDLVTLFDVIEHVAAPQDFLRDVATRCRWILLHIPLDDRLTTLLLEQYNYRLRDVGHISFWNTATAINTLTAAGLLPLKVLYTPGFRAPSSRATFKQRLAALPRSLAFRVSPGATARILGGVSLAVLCRGRDPR